MTHGTNRFEKKAIELRLVNGLYQTLEDKLRDCHMTWEAVGETDKQVKDWRTGELKWEDEEKTIPKMEKKYDYVEVPDEEISDDARLEMDVIKEIMSKLEKTFL